MFFTITFFVSWFIWLIFADKKRWREIFPVCIFAAFLGCLADNIIEHSVMYWDYYSAEHILLREISNDFGVYAVSTYLFIQWMPKRQSFSHMFSYWFAWTGITITIEYIHIQTGHMIHLHGWDYWHSYLADWILFWLFYKFHKIFDFRKTTNTN